MSSELVDILVGKFRDFRNPRNGQYEKGAEGACYWLMLISGFLQINNPLMRCHVCVLNIVNNLGRIIPPQLVNIVYCSVYFDKVGASFGIFILEKLFCFIFQVNCLNL